MLLSFKPVILLSDLLLFLFIIFAIYTIWRLAQAPHWKIAIKHFLAQPAAIFSGLILLTFFSCAILDSLHFNPRLPHTSAGQSVYAGTASSALDILFSSLTHHSEKTYSAPFASVLYTKDWEPNAKGEYVAVYPSLNITDAQHSSYSVSKGWLMTIISWASITILLYLLIIGRCKYKWQKSMLETQRSLWQGQTSFPWRTFFITLSAIVFVLCFTSNFIQHYHILGTDKVGNDVFYLAIKSIRTGILIGGLTTLFTLPFAIIFGILAGYWGGKVDDIIQYIYTTISSIPGILLIAAAVLSIQVYLVNHPNLFTTVSQRADLRLVALCLILGLTGWIGLCRVLRAETLKLREMDFVLVARTLGTRWPRILLQHILPNILHIIIVTTVLDFSSLVLAEAVLTYVGVGVDPSTISWGNMIDGARLELAREPIVWWPLVSAFSFMFIFVLAINVFGDALNKALNPRED